MEQTNNINKTHPNDAVIIRAMFTDEEKVGLISKHLNQVLFLLSSEVKMDNRNYHLQLFNHKECLVEHQELLILVESLLYYLSNRKELN